MSGFWATRGKGMQMTFANGYTISVQWGFGNYCDNHHKEVAPGDGYRSNDAECAVWDERGEFVRLSEHDDVRGWMSADDVARLIAETAARPRQSSLSPASPSGNVR